MPTAQSRVNRGPAAAAQNRASILAAAHRVYDADGIAAPLSVIAKEAGVSQGVMYRHFRTRLDLALAVFETNFVELDDAARPLSPTTFETLWRTLLLQTVRESSFVEMVVEARRTLPGYDGEHRVRALLAQALEHAQADGVVEPTLTVDHVMLAWRMAFGIVVTADSPEGAWDALERAGLVRAPSLTRWSPGTGPATD